MTKSHKLLPCIIYLFCFLFQSFSTDLYDKAVETFRANKPDEAQKLILEVLEKEGPDASLYNYLGISYYQTNQLDKALESFIKGTAVPFCNKALLYFNAANTAFAMNDFKLAEKYFTSSIEDDERYTSSYLNRANTRIKLEKYAEAKLDYQKYLELKPDTEQKAAIEAMIAKLGEKQ